MKLFYYNFLFISFFIFFGCNKESSDITEINTPQSTNSITTSSSSSSNTTDLVSPNLNQSPITFEETTFTFSEENRQRSNRITGNWGRFGGIGTINLSLVYAENPETNNENQSLKVIKVTEPPGIQSWAGFYLVLEEKIIFPEDKKAISIQFYSPGPGHTVLLKLEDELPNNTPGKKTTGDLFAETIGTGWETLIYNIPELDGRNGIYNTITIILGHNISNSVEVNYYFDNIKFSSRSNTLVDLSNIDQSEEVTIYEDYQLVWNDEFNYSGAPLEEKWHLQYIPLTNSGWQNNEKQHYTRRLDNSFVSDGTLKIVAKREIFEFEGINKSFTSARLNSKFNIRYGRIDISAKLPSSQGTWPAIWTMGTNVGETGNYYGTSIGNVGWPECGEIDIMEQNGSNKQILYGTFHWADSGGQAASYGLTKDVSSLNISDVTSEFHLYSLIWGSTSIKIYVDNLLVVELANTSEVPFDNPHYLLLNIAMGGTLGGNIPGDFDQDTMEIDYVRFYK